MSVSLGELIVDVVSDMLTDRCLEAGIDVEMVPEILAMSITRIPRIVGYLHLVTVPYAAHTIDDVIKIDLVRIEEVGFQGWSGDEGDLVNRASTLITNLFLRYQNTHDYPQCWGVN